VPPGDRIALRDALRTLVTDDALRTRMGVAAAARQAALFTPETVVPQYEEAYELALERRRARSGHSR
jgi:glycosyltransferase involved in cell wall biosynthesis